MDEGDNTDGNNARNGGFAHKNKLKEFYSGRADWVGFVNRCRRMADDAPYERDKTEKSLTI
jgi:outer membrane protein assembly factor BamD (BamD/ComL family)